MNAALKSVANFWEWWTDELAKLIPGWAVQLWHQPERRLVLSIVDEKIALVAENFKILEQDTKYVAMSAGNLEQLASQTGKYLKQIPRLLIGVRMGPAQCLIFQKEYPMAVKRQINDILKLELDQKTPFKSDEIYTDFTLRTSSKQPNKIEVTHLVIKQEILNEVIGKLNTQNIKIDFADVWSETFDEPYPINFIKDQRAPKRSSIKGIIIGGLLTSVGILACFALFLTFSKQEQALKELHSLTAQAQKNANVARKKTERVDNQTDILRRQMLTKIGRHTIIEIWEEITKRLPDSVWVTGLRIRSGVIHISGFAGSAASLVEILDNSQMFQKSRLTAQVRVNPIVKMEQFSLETRVIVEPIKNPTKEAKGRS